MFNIIELLFPVIFILIFIMIIFTLAKGISAWHKNNNSPRLTVSARIVAKRQNTTYHNHPNAGDTSGLMDIIQHPVLLIMSLFKWKAVTE